MRTQFVLGAVICAGLVGAGIVATPTIQPEISKRAPAAAAATSNPCTTEDFAQMRELIQSDVTRGADTLLDLFQQAESGKLDCKSEITPIHSRGGVIAMCGVSEPLQTQKISLSGGRTWNFEILHEKVQCNRSNSRWMQSITVSQGDLTHSMILDDRIMVQVSGDPCAKGSDYRFIRFAASGGRNPKIVNKLLTVSNVPVCAMAPRPRLTLEIPLSTLGLPDAELEKLSLI